MRLILLIVTTLALLAVGSVQAEGQQADVAAAPRETQTQNGVQFLSGGVSDSEQNELLVLDDEYNLRVALTNADGSYLHGVDVVIENAAGDELVETTTRGPILLARLQAGRYFVRAASEGRTAERRVVDVPKMPEQARLYVALAQMQGS